MNMDVTSISAEMENLQFEVRDTVLTLGGYWRPLSAVARLLEELGEIGEILTNDDLDLNSLNMELADVFIIATCIADQYCANLARSYRHLDFDVSEAALSHACPATLRITLSRLIDRAGHLARLINHLEGDKPIKKTETVSNVEAEVTRIHATLLHVTTLIGHDLFRAVRDALEASARRDCNRFSVCWDPSTATSLIRFRQVIRVTPCPFSERARVWGAPDYDNSKSIHQNAFAISNVLARFCRVAPYEGLDGYVIELNEPSQINDVRSLSRTLLTVLTVLGEIDKAAGRINCMEGDLLSPDWRFSFANLTFFISTFAPFYDPKHPRYSQMADAAFIFMQPEFSFYLHGIHRGNSNRDSIKIAIRHAFDRHTLGYSTALVEQPVEALKYIKPLDKYAAPVRWWQMDELSSSTNPPKQVDSPSGSRQN
ncbi:MazG-like nucleotide pyrophosphohydrolase family protein [Trinickia symbiotica]|nr:YqcI/YcgG family protein [Trinickia symbiotica]PPK42628.1 MazG-like nucleotide pyrophosphohydrolase family protein [Trinickia symbiotica]